LERIEVKNIAHLARLAINEDDMDGYISDLSSILELVEEMNSANVDGVTPMAHPLNMSQRLRIDKVLEVNQRDVLLRNAPLVENDLFLVPKVIE
jgi:aspartyl-tRNA(Asn)/glutamyl-tRNA(Gln) amidotransferase subunit C